MTADQIWDLTDTVERQAYLDLAMSDEAQECPTERASRNATKVVTVLSSVASLLAIYDLSLLARLGR